MLPNLREINDEKNVKNTLISCVDQSIPFFIWIKEGHERIKTEAQIIQVDFESGIVGIFKDATLQEDKINMDVFLFQEEKKILFKGVIQKIEDEQITIQIDPKIFLQENRKRGRFYFKKIDVVVKVQVQGVNEDKSFYANLSDISEVGMCFEVLKSKDFAFEIKSAVNLINIEGIKFPEKISGKIAHLTHFQDQFGEHLQKIGIAFNESNPIISEVMMVMGNTKKP